MKEIVRDTKRQLELGISDFMKDGDGFEVSWSDMQRDARCSDGRMTVGIGMLATN